MTAKIFSNPGFLHGLTASGADTFVTAVLSASYWSNLDTKTAERVLSYDVASMAEITPCNKLDKPLVIYRCLGNVMTPITTLLTQ